MTEPVLTKRQVAKKLECSVRTVERHIKPALKVGGTNRYYESDVMRQLAGVPESGGTVVAFPTRGAAA